jgi:adenosylcobinamide kinase / adenosylcobinamide-phosphate guanylyltransferase
MSRSELILGGQKSGKSRRAELLARDWLAASPTHQAVLIATAQPWDEEMVQRIARHQRDRAQRVPGLQTLEEPLALADALTRLSTPETLVVVDCLTLWLTNWLMPATAPNPLDAPVYEQNRPLARMESPLFATLIGAIGAAPGPVVLVGNEIGLGVIPLGREVRAFVDALGGLNQAVAAACPRVTLMVAGLPLTVKE